MPRSLGGTNTPCSTSHTVSPAMTILPASGRSSPARQRSVVVLPQPDGPSSVISLPEPMPRLMPSTAFTTTLPGATKVFVRFSIANMNVLPCLRLGRGRFAAPLHPHFEPAQARHDHDQRNDLDDTECGDRAVAAALLPHGQADGAEHMRAGTDQEYRGAEFTH